MMATRAPKILHKRLIKNALAFADHAAQVVSDDPRQSVISFAAAIELFIKARLFSEHWTLVLDKPGTKRIRQLSSGDFKSVSFGEARSRLETVADETLTRHEVSAFQQLITHRNKCIHFFDPEYHDATGESVAAVVAEQLGAWFYLHRLITGRWKKYFKRWSAEIARIDKVIQKNRHYIKGRFVALKPEIDELCERGTAIEECPSCGYVALKVDDEESPLTRRHCLVCAAWHDFLTAQCPDCGADVHIEQDAEATCGTCEEQIGIDELLKQFGETVALGDPDPYGGGIHCSYCDRWDAATVVEWGSGFLCLNCLEEGTSIEACEWCNEYYLGFDPEGSYLTGCELCGGSGAWRDD